MRLVFAGTPEVALPSLAALLDSSHEVVAVVTRPDAPTGRGRTLRPSPVAELAAEAGLEILRPPTPKDPEFLARLSEIAPDCAPVVAYGGLLPDAALAIPAHGWVNLHFSLLPAWRGAAPVQRAVLAGDEITGATAFRIVRELDAGPVFGILTETIRPGDTSGALLERLASAGAGLLLATIDGIESGTVEAMPQPSEGVSLAPKLNVPDAEVDWKAPAMHVDRLVRACTPAPAAWTTFRGERLRLGPLTLRQDCRGLAPGELVVEKNTVLVGTGSHGVALGEVTAPGKKAMRAADWARGARPEIGEFLGGPA
ncbi:methionyl-tRNA formyltransferase [Sporichthya sp.]|uniref:methionyl-tRNA formyltransferase n=1 Tax=Sporichthya sp. TaxID=65475 RepID=UPI0017E6EF52|nr:methionyl-tRNA formyltransferase [Sporichthya sp.]MBA3745853.1 methionyl-tRNA formyltransferase [Sporichthya sp.]